MNSPSLIKGETLSWSVDYFVNIVQYVCYILSAYFYFIIHNDTYVVFIVITILLAAIDCFEEGKDMIPESRRMRL